MRALSSSSTVRSAVGAILFCAFMGKLVFFFQEMVVAALFGADQRVDAVVTARLIPSFLGGVVGSAIAFGMIPVVQESNAVSHRERVSSLVRRLIIGMSLVFTCLAVVCSFLGTTLVQMTAPGYDLVARGIAGQLLAPSFAVALLDSIALILVSLLQAERRFLIAGVAAVLNGVTSVGTLFILGTRFGGGGIIAAATAGSLLQCALLTVVLQGTLRTHGRAVDPKPLFARMVSISGPAVLTAAVTGLVSFADRAIASTLGEGSVAIVNWAQKVNNLPLGLFALPLATAVYPFLTVPERPDEHGRVSRSISTVCFLLIPCAVLYMATGDSIVQVLFARGSFASSDVARTAAALSNYGLGLVFMGLAPLLTRISYSSGDRWGPLVATLCTLIAYLVLGIWLARVAGIAGLALAYSGAAAMGCSVMAVRLGLKGVWIPTFRRIRDLAGLLGAGVLAALILLAWREVPVLSHAALGLPLIRLAAVALIGIGVYVVGCYLFSVSIGMQVVSSVRESVIGALRRY